jgi:hypothetical protein
MGLAAIRACNKSSANKRSPVHHRETTHRARSQEYPAERRQQRIAGERDHAGREIVGRRRLHLVVRETSPEESYEKWAPAARVSPLAAEFHLLYYANMSSISYMV